MGSGGGGRGRWNFSHGTTGRYISSNDAMPPLGFEVGGKGKMGLESWNNWEIRIF